MTMAYDVAGDAARSPYDAVLLLHSSVADRRMWEPQWAPLAAHHRVVRADLRGFGDTPLQPGGFSNAQDVVGLLDGLGAASVALVASSFGGRVAIEVAATHPERITTLALLASAASGYPFTAEVQAFGAREDELLEAGDVDAATELNVRTWLGPEAGDEAAALVRVMQRRAFEVQLPADSWPDPPTPRWGEADAGAIAARTLVVSGHHDFGYFRDLAADLAQRIRNARHIDLDWAGHLPSLERPDEVTSLLLDHLAAR
jgi:3-oxoadipate enol-lactonase